MWTTIIGWLVGPLINGIFSLFGKRLQSADDKLAGMKEQKLADDEASLKAAADATRASGAVAGESDAQVRADLAGDFRK